MHLLGGGEFVQKVLERADEEFEQSTRLQNRGLSLDSLLSRIANHYGIETDYLRTASKKPDIVTARSVLCYLMVRKLKVNGIEVALNVNITPSAVSKAIIRGQSVIAGTGVEKHLLEC